VRALARDRQKARRLPKDAEVIVGDLTRPETLAPAVEGLDAIVFTHGSDGGGKAGSKPVDYGGVRNVIAALTGRSVRVALMTAIGMTNREDDYNRQLAQVLVASLTSESALRKTFELVAVKGPAQHDSRRCSRRLRLTRWAGWTPCATSRTCHCPRSRSGCEMTFER
jgi:hypothetical protein